MDDIWLTTDEAAVRLERSRNMVLKLLAAGELRGRRLGPATRGGQWLVEAASVTELLARWAVDPPHVGRPASADPSPAALAQRRSRERRGT